MNDIEKVNFETFKSIWSNARGGCNDEYLTFRYNEWMEEVTDNRQFAMNWWNTISKSGKIALMDKYWEVFRPFLSRPHFVCINTDNISGREIEILFNNKK